jgi:hypothetical protein
MLDLRLGVPSDQNPLVSDPIVLAHPRYGAASVDLHRRISQNKENRQKKYPPNRTLIFHC